MSVLFPALDLPQTAIMGFSGRRNCFSVAAEVKNFASMRIAKPRNCAAEDLVDVVHADEMDAAADFFGDLLDVFFVLLGNDNLPDADPRGRER